MVRSRYARGAVEVGRGTLVVRSEVRFLFGAVS